jgi:hypothetical protein
LWIRRSSSPKEGLEQHGLPEHSREPLVEVVLWVAEVVVVVVVVVVVAHGEGWEVGVVTLWLGEEGQPHELRLTETLRQRWTLTYQQPIPLAMLHDE